jgi:hypothetical protein
VSGERERKQMRERETSRELPRLISIDVGSVYGEPRWTLLGIMGGVWGRRRELVLGDMQVVSVAGRVTRYWVSFKE